MGWRRHWFWFLSLLLLFFTGRLPGGASEPARIGCSNSFLASVVNGLLGEEVQCLVLDDLHANGAVQALKEKFRQSRLFLYHPFQSSLLKAMEQEAGPRPKCIPVRCRLNPASPEDYLQAARELQTVLIEEFPEYSQFIRERSEALRDQIKTTEIEAMGKVRRSRALGVACFAAKTQERFLAWLGLAVVATFADEEILTPARLEELAQLAKTKQVRWVLGNQTQQGRELAGRVSAAISGDSVLLWASPQMDRDGESYRWQDFVRDNVDTILQAGETP